MRKLSVLILIILFFSCSTENNVVVNYEFDGVKFNPLDFKNDMFLPGEGIPAGVPDNYGWKFAPDSTFGYGFHLPEGWTAIIGWGQVYPEQSQPNPDQDFPLVRVHIKDIQVYIYLSDDTWLLIQNVMDPEGYNYVENFADDERKPADIVYEKEGGISVQAGSGFNFHFWSHRVDISRYNIKGVFVVCKARLLGTENYDTPSKYLMGVGGDYWRDLTSEWAPDDGNNADIALGRFKFITPEWQYFTMHTFSPEDVKKIVFPLEQ